VVENFNVDINGALHFMLGAVLVEIRASDSMEFIKNISNVFHNLPFSLLKCSTTGEYDACLADLMSRARRFGMEDYIEKLYVASVRAVKKNQEG